ncbi:MAG: branched-chain amino acid transaminase [Thermoplasmata archaeon]|uniref:Branched-chain-amino-acid aminotransferase n=1 Tax=Candidatus Sysuiplasma superficiale TaxID=2823368 RepID=A0A8J7YQX7_9ARCH|nr:branched-chain amino acid transaminase [Candidatus Sysuiplasma superficiale]MBX8644865.1 branched-chain amino acid transaminase [Candidatus Sysuiplasma superficiale]MCL5437148.1 branched-chain amino acid transaminase [Candidatus Thermoplasmatota archaeon]
MSQKENIVLLNGKYVSWKDARIHVSTHGLLYGSGVFEGIRGYQDRSKAQVNIFRLREHVERIYRNASILRLKPPVTADEFSDGIVEVVRRNGFQTDVYIRPMIYFGEGGIGIKPKGHSTDYFIFATEFGNYFGEPRPLNVCVSSWVRGTNNSMPPSAKISGSYVNSMLASVDAMEAGFDEALMLTHNGYVSEGSGENVFIVKGGKLITPPVSADILEGITRDSVMRLAADSGIQVIERDISRTELYTCDEMFLCGTAAQITPVGSVDRRTISNGAAGEITSRLMRAFESAARGAEKRYADWLTPVYE